MPETLHTSTPGTDLVPPPPPNPDVRPLPSNRVRAVLEANPERSAEAAADGRLETIEAGSAQELLAQARPVSRFRLTRARLTGPAEDGRLLASEQVAAELAYEELEDFTPPALIGKTLETDAEAGTDEIARRPLLDARLEGIWLRELRGRLADPSFRALLQDDSRRQGYLAALTAERRRLEASGDEPGPDRDTVKLLGHHLPALPFSLAEGEAESEVVSPREANLDNVRRRDEILARKPLTVAGAPLPVTQRALYVHRLSTHEALLGRWQGDVAAFVQLLDRLQTEADEVFAASVRAALAAQLPLKTAYVNFHELAEQARGEGAAPAYPIVVVNTSAARLAADPKLFAQFEEGLPGTTSLDLDGWISLVVLPGAPPSVEFLRRLGELGMKTRTTFALDFPDYVDLKDVARDFRPGGPFYRLKGPEPWKGFVVLVGPSLVVREGHCYAAEDNAVALSPAAVWAGMTAASDDRTSPGIAVAGDEHAIALRGVPTSRAHPRLPLRDREQLKTFESAVIPVAVRTGGRLVFWNAETLSSDPDHQQVPVHRTRCYVEMVLVEFLNSQVFRENDQVNVDRLHEALTRFIRANSGPGKMLAGGRVKSITAARDEYGNPRLDALKITLELGFKYCVKHHQLLVVNKSVEYLAVQNDDGQFELQEQK